jgi:hypothetical protein
VALHCAHTCKNIPWCSTALKRVGCLPQDDMKARNTQLGAVPEDDERFPLSPSRSSQVWTLVHDPALNIACVWLLCLGGNHSVPC